MSIFRNLAITSIFIVAGTQNPAAALVNNQATQTKLESITTQELITKQPTIVAINDKYWGPQRDFEIRMPGNITSNKSDTLASWSSVSRTAYISVHQNMPSEVFYLSTTGIRQLLQRSMRTNVAKNGKVVKSTNLVIEGYPGLEMLVQHNDGKQGQYRAFVVKGRMYVLGAVTEYELTTEAANFFDSFRVYPQQLGYSR
ncbi:MAG: hypothetical protein KME23_28120 [Goleter apudmare HA4340-LM2]|jgi:hypothetical protein|nr:hypothetical protein [Goleter apudmare HA4340-LM2]